MIFLEKKDLKAKPFSSDITEIVFLAIHSFKVSISINPAPFYELHARFTTLPSKPSCENFKLEHNFLSWLRKRRKGYRCKSDITYSDNQKTME